MSEIKLCVVCLALTWAVIMITACGKQAIQSSGDTDPKTKLIVAKQSLDNLLANSNVMSVASPGTSDCALVTTSATASDAIPQLKNIEDALTSLLKNVQEIEQSQDTSNLDTDLQDFEDVLNTNINDLLVQVDACLPADPGSVNGSANQSSSSGNSNMTTAPNAPAAPVVTMPNIPDIKMPVFPAAFPNFQLPNMQQISSGGAPSNPTP